jgi:hypothetical protein
MYVPLLFSIRAKCPVHLILVYMITQIIFDVGTDPKAARCVVFSTLLLHIPLRPKSQFLRRILVDPQPPLFLSLNVSDQILHPKKKIRHTYSPYILILIFWYIQVEHRRFCA